MNLFRFFFHLYQDIRKIEYRLQRKIIRPVFRYLKSKKVKYDIRDPFGIAFLIYIFYKFLDLLIILFEALNKDLYSIYRKMKEFYNKFF